MAPDDLPDLPLESPGDHTLEEPAPRLPTLRQALALYATVLALAFLPAVAAVLLAAVAQLAGGPGAPQGLNALLLREDLILPETLASQLLLILAPVLLWTRLFRWDLSRTFGLRRAPWPVYLYVAFGSLSFIPLGQEMELAVERLIPVPSSVERIFQLLLHADSTPDFVLTLTAVALIPGVVEELLFRGVMLRALLPHLPRRTAIVACAVLFALLHLNPWQFAGAIVLGTIYGAIVVWTESLYPVILAHMLNNAAFIVLANTTDPDAPPPPLAQRAIALLLGLAIFVYCMGRIRARRTAIAGREEDAAPTG